MPIALEHLKSYVSLPRPWLPGAYRVDVIAGGETIGSVPFRIRGDARRARFTTPKLSYRATAEAPVVPFEKDNSVIKVGFCCRANLYLLSSHLCLVWLGF